MRESLYDFCISERRQELLEQWEEKANLPLTPSSISRGSKRKVWWQCEKGHRWQAAVYTRTCSGSGCPVCAGKVAQRGENDLGTLFPELARQWHPTRNGGLTPSQVLPGSHRMVWWICKNGHEWRARVKSRTVGCNCPVCANREICSNENDLASQYPRLAAQWDMNKNGSLTPDSVVPGTTRKVWWICEKGHEWQASVASRVSGSGCPVCSGKKVLPGENDLASQFPAIAAQWNSEKNGKLSPQQVTPSSNRKVWWICEKGHEYEAVVAARTRGSECPYCTGKKVLPGFNDLATLEPTVAAQWHPVLNGTLTAQMVTAGSHRRVWWQCDDGHVWKAVIYARAGPQKCGCPVCAGVAKRRYVNPELKAIKDFHFKEGQPKEGQPVL
ncbi:MAG: zinc-ribbon domain-containing protein [Oscillospiraceae bacterium]|nr:zinc-ribbon domain-containing protein [Oscillospiraceae bacterium]